MVHVKLIIHNYSGFVVREKKWSDIGYDIKERSPHSCQNIDHMVKKQIVVSPKKGFMGVYKGCGMRHEFSTNGDYFVLKWTMPASGNGKINWKKSGSNSLKNAVFYEGKINGYHIIHFVVKYQGDAIYNKNVKDGTLDTFQDVMGFVPIVGDAVNVGIYIDRGMAKEAILSGVGFAGGVAGKGIGMAGKTAKIAGNATKAANIAKAGKAVKYGTRAANIGVNMGYGDFEGALGSVIPIKTKILAKHANQPQIPQYDDINGQNYNGKTKYFIAVTEKGGNYNHNVNNNSELGDTIKQFHEEKKDVSVVAVGPGQCFAVVADNGAAVFNGPDNFIEKMSHIDREDIIHISFGYDNQWAITMKNGFCHCWLLPKPLAAVKKHQNNITYVSLCIHEDDWIVGWGKNGWTRSAGLCDKLKEYLDTFNKNGNQIFLVEIGNHDRYVIKYWKTSQYYNGREYEWNINKDLSDWLQENDRYFLLSTISLW
eukprot:313424_1